MEVNTGQPPRSSVECRRARRLCRASRAFGIIDISHRKPRESTLRGRGNFLMAESEVNLTKTYDPIVIGFGAVGGMAPTVLTSHRLQVPLLEAGNKLPIQK